MDDLYPASFEPVAGLDDASLAELCFSCAFAFALVAWRARPKSVNAATALSTLTTSSQHVVPYSALVATTPRHTVYQPDREALQAVIVHAVGISATSSCSDWPSVETRARHPLNCDAIWVK